MTSPQTIAQMASVLAFIVERHRPDMFSATTQGLTCQACTLPKGRTGYGPARYAGDTGDTETSGQAAIAQLLACGLVLNDHNDDGVECWRLAHYDWQRGDTIGGYSRDAGQKRDGLPPMYGRHVNDVIGPNGPPFTPPADTHWTHLVTQEDPT